MGKDVNRPSTRVPAYLIFSAMIGAACGLIYLALAQLPRQKYILQSMFEEQARRLLSERIEALERQIAREEQKTFSSLNPIDQASFVLQEGWAEVAFLLNSQFTIVLPVVMSHYPQWQGGDSEVASDTSPGRFFAEGREYEFASGRYDEAVKFYSLALEQAVDPDLEIKIRLALAPCLFKLKRYDEAADQAQKAASGAKEKAIDPYLELMGWYWYAMALDAMDNPKAVAVLLSLYERILKRDFFLPRKSQYLFWSNRLCELLHSRKLGDEEAKLFAELEAQSRFLIEAEGLCSFLDGQGINHIKDSLVRRPGSICHYYAKTMGDPHFIAYQALQRDQKFSGVRGFTVDLDYCRRALEPLLSPAGSFAFALRSPAEDPLWDTTTERAFPIASLPLSAWEGFQVAVYQNRPDQLEKMITREKFFTLLITGIIAGVLLAGLYFTWKNFLRAVELSRLKSDFVAGISHELRTPLALIQSCTETLSLGRVKDEKRDHYYQTIMRETGRLTRLITNVLNISQIEAGRFHIVWEKIALSSLLTDLINEKAGYWPDYRGQIKLEIADLPPLTLLDGEAMRSAIFNLLDNAVKYGPQDQDIVVGGKCDGREICLWVEDHGRGIAAEEQKQVLQKFYRGRSSRGTRGIGLGLKIVFDIVRAHGGTTSLRSAMGKGTRVSLKIPLHLPEDKGHA